jgi:short-subunit dehydrogenase
MNTKQEKVIVITGATSGIGLSTIKNLAKSRHFVIGIGRSGSLCRKLEGELRNETENENIYFITCNLALQKNIEMLAEI